MVLDMELDQLFKEIGHDGGEILYPSSPEPDRRRSFHPSEFIWPALVRGYAVVPVELNPYWETPSGGMEKVSHAGGNKRFLQSWLARFNGVITGQTPKGLWHACAWDHERELLFDPAYSYHKPGYMQVHTFWAAVPRRMEDVRQQGQAGGGRLVGGEQG